jgi:hypothetical protein
MQQHREDRSLGELFADLARESSTLVRQELELAKTELAEKATGAARHVGLLAAGGAVAYAGFLAILAAIVIGLAGLGLPWWLAALIVGVVAVGAGYSLVRKALETLKHESLAPRQTMKTIRDDVQWAKEQVH